MMPTAPPIPSDPSQIYLTMPTPAPVRSKSRVLDVLKLLLGVVIALILAAILAVLIFAPNTSNENLARLQRESNENIARLEREQIQSVEDERVKRQNELMEKQWMREMQRFERGINLTEIHRLEDRLIAQQQRAEDVERTMEQAKRELEMEQKRYELLLEERQLAEERRREDLDRANAELVSNFMEEFVFKPPPLNIPVIGFKVHSLLRRLDSIQKSSLIDNLYKAKLLSANDPNNPPLDLNGANLVGLDLDGTDEQSGQVGPSQSYTGLALPSTNLINASFDHLYLDDSDFNLSDMMGVSFRASRVHRGNFTSTLLSLSNFDGADVSQSIFTKTKMQYASFVNALLSQTQMDNADIGSTNFQFAKAVEANFSRSEMSLSDFQQANLSRAQMYEVSARSANFYFAKAIGTNFTSAYMPDSLFEWTDLREASFRYAVLPGANFENANVQDVDFTRAFLPGAHLTSGQLDVVLSITNATLPDSSIGKNKNLVKNNQAQCSDMNGTISNWTVNGNVFINGSQGNDDCAFQAGTINATLQQSIDIRRYQGLVQNGRGHIYIEMQDKTTAIINPSVYMLVRFFDAQKIEINGERSTLDMPSYSSPPKFTTTFPCPSNTVELQVTIIFRQIDATVDNIYITIE